MYHIFNQKKITKEDLEGRTLYVDFDGTLFKNLYSKIVGEGFKINKKLIPYFFLNVNGYLWKEVFNQNNKQEFENMTKIFKDVLLESVVKIAEKTELNGIDKLVNILPKRKGCTEINILSLNDVFAIEAALTKKKKDQLKDKGIMVNNIIANEYGVYKGNTKYNGKVKLNVNGNKMDFVGENGILFGDFFDRLRYRRFENFVRI